MRPGYACCINVVRGRKTRRPRRSMPRAHGSHYLQGLVDENLTLPADIRREELAVAACVSC